MFILTWNPEGLKLYVVKGGLPVVFTLSWRYVGKIEKPESYNRRQSGHKHYKLEEKENYENTNDV